MCEALTKHALELWKQEERDFSPCTLILGKGGPKPDGGYYPATEQSLYRHCMEVAVLAVWFFHHKWQAGRLPLRSQEDPEPALRQVFAIAFAHDADKLAGEPSQCPKPHHVHVAYEMLSMEKWSGLSEWVASGGPPMTAKEPTKPDQKIYPLLGLAGGEGILEEHPFWRAAVLAAVIGEGGGHEAEARLQRLLDRQDQGVRRGLGQNGMEAGALDKITLRSVAALQAALLTMHEPLETLLDEIRGQWQQADHGDPEATAIVQRLRAQAGLDSHLMQDGKDDPYRPSAHGGCCLLCGAPTLQAIESNRMSLAGIKSSAFSNRIGHEKHLWLERGENYICPACPRVQEMLLRVQEILFKLAGRLTEMPLLVATPVRHLIDTRTPNYPQELLRSFDAASSKPEMIRKLFP